MPCCTRRCSLQQIAHEEHRGPGVRHRALSLPQQTPYRHFLISLVVMLTAVRRSMAVLLHLLERRLMIID